MPAAHHLAIACNNSAYPLLWQGRNNATFSHQMAQSDLGGPRGRPRGFSEALSSFPGSPGSTGLRHLMGVQGMRHIIGP